MNKDFFGLSKVNEYLTTELSSDDSRKNYLFYINYYLSWVDKQGLDITQTNETHVKKFIEYATTHYPDGIAKKKDKRMSTPSINLVKASLKLLYRVNDLQEIVKNIKSKRPDDNIPKIISKEELLLIIEKSKILYERPNDLYKNKQLYFFITLLYQSGARINEATKVLRADFDFERNVVKLGSKRSEYLRKLLPDWIKDFKEWCRINNRTKEVFLNDEGKLYSKRNWQHVIEKLCFKALKKKYSAHRFRASCITHRLEAGEDFFSVSSNFHKTVDTTRHYAGATARSLNKMVNPMENMGE